MSSLTPTHSYLRSVVGKICHDIGWHSAMIPALNVLSDLLHYYMRKLTITAVESANHAGRSEPNIADMDMAFRLLNINMDQLIDYVSNVESSPMEFDLPLYPIPTRSNRVLDNYDPEEERPEYYSEWLPSLKYKSKSFELEASTKDNLKTTIANNVVEEKDNEKQKEPNNNNVTLEKCENESDDLKLSKNDDELELELGEDDQKNKDQKLVFKFSMGKSLEETAAQDNAVQNSESSNKVALYQSTSCADIDNHLMSSKAYIRFTQDLITLSNLENSEIWSKLRLPDTQRLPNEYKSRENSPEPEPENQDLTNNPLEKIGNNLNLEDLSIKKIKKIFKTKKTKPKDEAGELTFGDKQIKVSNIKVKEIGKKIKKECDGSEKKPRPKKSKENSKSSLSIKLQVGGLGLNNEDQPLDVLNEQNINLDPNEANNDKSETTPKKRQYKRKVPKEPKEKKPRKPKADAKQMQNANNLDFVPSPISDASFSSNLFSPKNKKTKNSDLYNESETNKSMGESIDASVMKELDVRKQNDESLSNFSENESFTDLGDSNLKSTNKKTSRQPSSTAKRKQGVNSKKIVKSAEVIESSGDSSSDEADVDKNPISLLPLPEFPNESVDMEMSLEMKRVNSNSSLSSVSSIHSSKSSHSNALAEIPFEHSGVEICKQKSNDEQSKTKAEKSTVEKKDKESSKHKKNKKHSKNKHRHGDEKFHKKHKKTKDKDKNKERDKDSNKSKDKEKEKLYKPKLSIKFGQIVNPEEHGEVPKTPQQIIKEELDEESFINVKESMNISKEIRKDENIKKKRPAKMKKPVGEERNELVFIKDTTPKIKESKIKKKQIINFAPSLLDESANLSEAKPMELFSEKFIDTKKIKEKDSTSTKLIEVVKHKKEKLKEKKEKDHLNKKNEIQSCTLIRETINVEGSDEKLWICPKCSSPDNGSEMICCDTCEEWYHFYCVGIETSNCPNGSWFCPLCFEKEKKSLALLEKLKPKTRPFIEDNGVTITPIPPINMPTNLTPSVSIIPIMTQNMSTTPSTSGYKPTGRKRGRPRKNSPGATPRQPSLTITPVAGPSNYVMDTQTFSASIDKKEHKKSKHDLNICPICLNSEIIMHSGMIRCDQCHQWYHWHCVGINNSPSPDSNWYCNRCNKKKQHQVKRLWNEIDSESESEQFKGLEIPAKSRRIMNTSQHQEIIRDSQDSDGKNACATCKQTNTAEAEPKWIQCDECDQWYHFICEKIQVEPNKDESWFCRNCIKKQRNIESQIHKKKKM